MFVKHLDRIFYPQIEAGWDDDLFRQFILKRMSPDASVLDLGAGAGIVPQMNFRGEVRRVCGVDPDPRVTTNPYLDEGRVGFGEHIPYSDAIFDLVFSDNVMEHLVEPEKVLTEVRRVLKPSGRFLFKTPNLRHYMPTIARLTPHRFHIFYNRLRGREPEDTFPTVYRANTAERLGELANKTNLEIGEILHFESRPEYLRLNALMYLAGIVWERTVNATPVLARYRIVLMGEMVKPSTNQ